MPFSVDGTLKLIPAIGTSPILVCATTFAAPDNVRAAEGASVTVLSNVWNAPSLVETSGTFLKESGRFATLPVETPPSTFVEGIVNYIHISTNERERESQETHGSCIAAGYCQDNVDAGLDHRQRETERILVCCKCAVGSG